MEKASVAYNFTREEGSHYFNLYLLNENNSLGEKIARIENPNSQFPKYAIPFNSTEILIGQAINQSGRDLEWEIAHLVLDGIPILERDASIRNVAQVKGNQAA